MATGSLKYNPFVVDQVKELHHNDNKVSNNEINNILKKQNFSDNHYLNSLQKETRYFKFQYFNPLKASHYYKNLDQQVLALITGDIGSMPDLKKPHEGDGKSKSQYEYQQNKDDKMTDTSKNQDAANEAVKYKRTTISLITAMVVIFLGTIIAYIYRLRKPEDS